MATQQQAEGQGAGFEASDLQGLLNKEFKPRSDAAKEAVETAVRTLAEQALAATSIISSDTIGTIEAMIAALDKKLSEQVNLIMHHKAFQEVESAWRGLNYLVTNTETDEMLKIRVMNISKADLGRTLKRYKGVAWDQSPIFKKLYEAEYGQFGGEPFGALVGDYFFDHTPPDVELLGQIAQVSAAAHCPFIAGLSPSSMQMESWQELANPRDLTKIFGTAEYAPWRSRRE
jgi:type VI secretion system protein ImpC